MGRCNGVSECFCVPVCVYVSVCMCVCICECVDVYFLSIRGCENLRCVWPLERSDPECGGFVRKCACACGGERGCVWGSSGGCVLIPTRTPLEPLLLAARLPPLLAVSGTAPSTCCTVSVTRFALRAPFIYIFTY